MLQTRIRTLLQTRISPCSAKKFKLTTGSQMTRKAPLLSGIGLVLLVCSIAWAFLTIQSSVQASLEFGGFAGFTVILFLMITVTVSSILGLIGLGRRKSPRYVPWSLVVLSAIPILIMLVELIITNNA